MTQETPSTLPAKLAAIMGEISTLSKDGQMGQKYKYVTDATVFNAVRPLLAQYNVALLSSMTGIEQNAYTTQKGTAMMQTIATFAFKLVCGDTGEVYESQWFAEANDAGDKGINKTATAALKNWLLKTFCIATGDDPDANDPPARTNPVHEMDRGENARHLTRDETTKLYARAKTQSLNKSDVLAALDVKGIERYTAVAPFAAALQRLDDYIEAQTTPPAQPKSENGAEQPALIEDDTPAEPVTNYGEGA